MKASDIHVGSIYYVNFDPTEVGEFGKKHLAVVLKKNNNSITVVAIPLTSNECGVGANKLELGFLECLPERLRHSKSYAVYDQVRVVSATRFETIKDQGLPWEAVVPEDILEKIYKAVIKDLISDLTAEQQLKLFLN
jgi:uncharacterized protein YifN (PemK superfamily)